METTRTAEFVTPKHPDKICDQVSDAILDAVIAQDPSSRVAIETVGGHGILTIVGEMTTDEYVDIPAIARSVAGTEGMGIQTNIAIQSPDIARGVDNGGAGDQGIMIGYATNETSECMPIEYVLARDLCMYLYITRGFMRDGKTQVTIDAEGSMKTIVASFAEVSKDDLLRAVSEWHDLHAKDHVPVGKACAIFANPAGDWDVSGFDADTGLTGRKLMVDNYGPQIAIGGGAFSGKDPTKVDRSGAYMARYIAKRYLIENYAESHSKVQVNCRLAYAIGVKDPVQATITVQNGELMVKNSANVADAFPDLDLTPKGIRKMFSLRKPYGWSYEQTARWGHFGQMDFPWEQV